MNNSAFYALAAAIAVFTGVGPSIAQGLIGAKAVEAIGRQPQASNEIIRAMVLAQSISETAALYGLIIAIMLVLKIV